MSGTGDDPQSGATPRRDKFAALASRTAEATPRRDKLAALAARQASADKPASSEAEGAADAQPQEGKGHVAARRDKFSALAAATSDAAADVKKDSETQGQSVSPTSMDMDEADAEEKQDQELEGDDHKKEDDGKDEDKEEDDVPHKEKGDAEQQTAKDAAEDEESMLKRLRTKAQQRRAVLADLDRAEQLTCDLLSLAHETTTALQDLSAQTDISTIADKYRRTLQEIHGILSAAGSKELIHAYQNHTVEATSSMYEARVEMRLAQERTQVLQAFSEIEEREASPQQLQPVSQSAGGTVAVSDADASRKRPRE